MTAAVTRPAGPDPRSGDPLALMQDHREQLTHVLRGLAARLDELDRRLTDLAWRKHRQHLSAAVGELLCERTALESERQRLNDRLGVLAKQLNTIDGQLSGGRSDTAAPRVGTCPYCGYPSLGSGLCAFCRPQLAR